MNWLEEWNALSSRIDGLINAGNFFVQTLQVNSSDSLGVSKHLSNQAREIFLLTEEYYSRNQHSLPQSAEKSLKRFIEQFRPNFSVSQMRGLDNLKIHITSLSCLKAELEYFMTDFSFMARKRSERAFIHLQQCIVADTNTRTQWQEAFKKGETRCEQLGGAHLLLHGIWAFKVSGPGAGTDLVFSEPLDENSAVQNSADALVLTEWKKVKTSAEKPAESARIQAGLYSGGILGGLELREYRYIVLVSKDRIKLPDDTIYEGSLYRHINIAVEPSVPSKATYHGINADSKTSAV